MLLVALDDRKARIEIGYGLEPILPDALAGRILREQLFPAFKQQRYADGLTAAVNRIVEIIERGEPASAADRHPGMPTSKKLVLIGFLAIFVVIGFFFVGAGLGARTVFLILFGSFFGGVPLLMGSFIAPPLAPIIHGIIALVMGWLGWRVSRQNPVSFRSGGSHPQQLSSDVWIWGASSGSGSGDSGGWSSGGFSSDWGGFSGGSSGGGGASGSW